MKKLILAVAIVIMGASSGRCDNDLQRKISLELDGMPIVAVLNMIASQNRLNLVVSGDVTGNVTLRLQDVDIATALDAVLTANGYNYFVRDDVILVKPAGTVAPDELLSKVFTLRYLSPVTAEKSLSPLLSDKGSLTILDRSSQGSDGDQYYHANRIMITDEPRRMTEMEMLLTEMDVRERTVLIEAKIIETKIDNSSNLGVEWPTKIGATLTKADDGSSTSSSSTTTTTDESYYSGIYNPNNGNWTWGKLSIDQVSMVLHMLEEEGNSKLVSDPRITTLENHEAEFKFTTIIPIQTINRFTEGSSTSDIVTFEDEEVGIMLKVTPRINEDGKITLDVEPTVEDIIGYSGPSDNQKPITASRSIRTRITVGDGETVALGGLLKEDNIESVRRVPILGHIPLIGGWLFSSKSVEKSSTDLLIMITPHVLD